MLTVLRDAQDKLLGCCEWWPVDEQGRWEPYGQYIYVNQLELNPGTGGWRHIRQIIRQIATAAPWAVGAYWERQDKTEDRLHAYRRKQLTMMKGVSR